MQDRFKFRCWDDIHREMLDLQKQDVNPYNISDIPQNNIMQCTGLKDKNGKLIFEGDIMKCLYISPIGEEISKLGFVEFNFGAFWFNYKIGSSYLYNENALLEIIGNTYENPELLEQ